MVRWRAIAGKPTLRVKQGRIRGIRHGAVDPERKIRLDGRSAGDATVSVTEQLPIWLFRSLYRGDLNASHTRIELVDAGD